MMIPWKSDQRIIANVNQISDNFKNILFEIIKSPVVIFIIVIINF